MKTVFIVLAITLYMGLSIYRKLKKQMMENQSGPARGPVGNQTNTDEYSVDDCSTSETDDLGQPYFTYEEEPAPISKKSKKVNDKAKSQSVAAPMSCQPTSVAEETLEFDLRQAVIYQTILNNPYVSEINQQNQ